jgi:hypothetical protein
LGIVLICALCSSAYRGMDTERGHPGAELPVIEVISARLAI